jgi:predicted Fe-Mo cluster-binding NifX family protein
MVWKMSDMAIRVAVPVRGGGFCEHFGGATEFAFFEGRRGAGAVVARGVLKAPEHGPGVLPAWLAGQKPDAVVAGAIGERALIMLSDAGIEVFMCTETGTPQALAEACLRGDLERATGKNSRCHGDHHGNGHPHGANCH